MKKKHNLSELTPICQVVTYGLLLLSVLFLVYTGIHLFQRVTKAREDADQLRSTLSYVQNQLFVCEDKSAVYVDQGPEGDMLCLPLREGRYEIRIYLYEGMIREELSKPGYEPDPSEAEKIAQATSFEVDLTDPALARIRIDGREALASLRRAGDE